MRRSAAYDRDKAGESMSDNSRLARGREAFERRAWGDAYAHYEVVDAELGLDLDDLGRFASVAYLVGEEQRCVDLLARSHHAATRSGDITAAARRGAVPAGG